jgi:hypothetical protein
MSYYTIEFSLNKFQILAWQLLNSRQPMLDELFRVLTSQRSKLNLKSQ